jgi:hypothetical protein
VLVCTSELSEIHAVVHSEMLESFVTEGAVHFPTVTYDGGTRPDVFLNYHYI